MSSRAKIAALLLSLSSLSCMPRVGEEPPDSQSPQVAGTACLTEAASVATRFISGEARDRELDGAWSCLGSAFTAFDKYMRGRSRDSYASDEIAKFFEDNFLEIQDPKTGVRSRQEIPPALQEQFMKLKQIFVGGSQQVLTRNELLSLVQRIDEFKRLTLRLNPFMGIFIIKWVPEEFGTRQSDVELFERANQAGQDVARDLGALIQKNHPAYQMDDFTTFLQELSAFVGDDWPAVESIRRFMPVAKKVKKALTGGSENQIEPAEWSTVLIMGVRGYVQYLRYYYFIETPGQAGRSLRLNYVARTFEDSFSIFEDLVREKPSHLVSRAELDEILEAFNKAWPDFKYSDALILEFMRIKQVLFGGAIDSIAQADFMAARLKVSVLKTIVEELMPHFQIYTGEWKPGTLPRDEAMKAFDAAKTQLEKSGYQFGELLESAYDLKNLTAFLKEWNRLYPPENSKPAGSVLERYMPLITRFKNTLYEDSGSVVSKGQWPTMLSSGSRVYSTYMFYDYFLAKRRTWRDVAALNAVQDFSEVAGNLVKDLILAKPSKKISREEFKQLLFAMDAADLMPDSLSAKELTPILPALFNRVLNPPVARLKGERPDGLRLTQLEYLRQELRTHLETQEFLAATFGGDQARLSAQELRSRIDRKLRGGGISAALRVGLTELQMVFNTNAPQSMDAQERLYITPRGRLKFNLKTVEAHNLMRTLSRLLVASYAENLNRIKRYQGLTLPEAETAFRDFRPLALSLDMIEPENTTFMSSRFREANIFVPRSDGNDLASFLEIHDTAVSIWSGLSLDNLIKPVLVQRCAPRGPVRAKTTVSYDCLFNVYNSLAPSKLGSLPELVQYASTLSAEQYNAVINSGLKAAGWVPDSSRRVKLGDASLLPQLLQYIEQVYARFDADADGRISVPEARRAFPLFEPILRKLAKKELESGTIREQDLIALFTYILKYGRPPSGVIEGIFKWYPWRDRPDSWVLETDRGQIAQILGYIADQISGAANSRMVPDEDATKPTRPLL